MHGEVLWELFVYLMDRSKVYGSKSWVFSGLFVTVEECVCDCDVALPSWRGGKKPRLESVAALPVGRVEVAMLMDKVLGMSRYRNGLQQS